VKHFKTYNEEKFKIPPKEIDDLLYKTIEIVKYEVKNDVEIGKDTQQGNLHLEILTLLQKEWDNRRVETNFVFRITDKIFRVHQVKKNFFSDVELC
jgi:hypothetical protein